MGLVRFTFRCPCPYDCKHTAPTFGWLLGIIWMGSVVFGLAAAATAGYIYWLILCGPWVWVALPALPAIWVTALSCLMPLGVRLERIPPASPPNALAAFDERLREREVRR